ncbi:MAG TPA: hypothetical protein VHC20_06365 [Candidatus Paceibacterota bacterium]|nr:hypothetical protein [Candidatus Paceibacterota bacterium]
MDHSMTMTHYPDGSPALVRAPHPLYGARYPHQNWLRRLLFRYSGASGEMEQLRTALHYIITDADTIDEARQIARGVLNQQTRAASNDA